MKKFRTNIKCEACVTKVAPGLDELAGQSNWNVDLKDPQRTLTVASDVDVELIKSSLKKAGYSAEATA